MVAAAATEKRPPSKVGHVASPLIVRGKELMTQFIDSLRADRSDVPLRWHHFSSLACKLIQTHRPKSEASQRVLFRGKLHRTQDIGNAGGPTDGREALRQQRGI